MIPVQTGGAVTIRGRSGTLNPYHASAVVGAAPQWGDDNDGTYATVWRSGRTVNESADSVDIAKATFDPLTTIDRHEILDVTLHLRASTSGGAARSISATLSGAAMGFVLSFETTPAKPYWDLTADGAIHDYVSPLTPDVLSYSFTTLSDVAYTLTNDTAYVEFARLRSDGVESVPYDSELTVYKVWLEVNAVAAGRTFMPPLRLFPREDGRGMSSAARVYPPPRTSRYGRIGPGSLI